MKLFIIAILIIFISPILLIVIEAIIAPIGAKNDYKNPDRQPLFYENTNPALTYLVLGDSTAAGVGADYDKGIAVSTAKYLSQNNNLTMYNFAVSGARVNDVLIDQIQYLKKQNFKPDIILISIGGNDVTHLTSLESITDDMQKIINDLIAINCNAKIILTGSPNVGTSRRFAQPLRWLVEWRSSVVNDTFIKIIKQNNITLAPIFKDTTEPFKNNPNLFYEDKFHPNAEGYAVWTKILNQGIDDAVKNQPGHCGQK